VVGVGAVDARAPVEGGILVTVAEHSIFIWSDYI
jgi:hypothetical protein